MREESEECQPSTMSNEEAGATRNESITQDNGKLCIFHYAGSISSRAHLIFNTCWYGKQSSNCDGFPLDFGAVPSYIVYTGRSTNLSCVTLACVCVR
jgi:hypothetical protein